MIIIRAIPNQGDLARLKDMPERVMSALRRMMVWGMEDARQFAMEEGFSGRPGLVSRNGVRGLKGSIYQRVEVRGSRITGYLASNLVYARIHELGGTTRPHVIRPRRAKALAFQMGGRQVFARAVNHPGSRIPARPYLSPALGRFMGLMDELADAAFRQEGLS